MNKHATIPTLIAATLTVASMTTGALAAEPLSGFYLGGAVGASRLGDLDLTDTALGFGSRDYITTFDNGVAVLGTVGFSFGNGWRTEIELARRSNDVSSFGPPTFNIPDVSGSFTATSGMINALYDVATGTAFTPYVGAGIGAAHINGQVSRPAGQFDETATAFAYQLILGASYSMSPKVDLFGQYSYFRAPSLDLSGPLSDPVSAATVTLDYSDDYVSQSLVLGVRYQF